jgi:ribosomal protein S18 acetylase RimI-like enzyme
LAEQGVKLRIIEFSAEHLARVQSFECGTEDWCRLAEKWIKSAPPFRGALQSIQTYRNTVWLYYIDTVGEEFLVGFSSLGTVEWQIPNRDEPKRKVGFLPMLAVSLRFQGKPDCENATHYIDEIMEHVLQQARERRYHELCLYVHEDNGKARRLYERHGFSVLGPRDDRGILRMLKRLDS